MEKQINSLFNLAGNAVKSFKDGLKTALDYNAHDIQSMLENVPIRKSQYTTEKNVETIIYNALNTATGKANRQYYTGGLSGLKVDIDIASGQVGIEIKLANHLDTTGIQRLFGQVLYYSKRTYKKNLIVCIVGLEKEYNNQIKEVESIIEDQGVCFYYLVVK